jgi:hypothetical protein
MWVSSKFPVRNCLLNPHLKSTFLASPTSLANYGIKGLRRVVVKRFAAVEAILFKSPGVCFKNS